MTDREPTIGRAKAAGSAVLQLRARYRREHPRPTLAREIEVDVEVLARSSALLLVDVYPNEGPEAEIVRSAIVPVKAAARRAGLRTVYVTNYLAQSTDETSEWRNVWLRTLGTDVLEEWAEPSDALRYLPEITPDTHDLVVRKQHYSGFADTNLDEVLRSLGTRDIFMVGFDARICLSSTATDALARNYRVFVVRDAIGTTEATDLDTTHNAAYRHAVRYLESCVGYTVMSTDFIEACARAVAG